MKSASARTFKDSQTLWAGTQMTANPPFRSGRSVWTGNPKGTG